MKDKIDILKSTDVISTKNVKLLKNYIQKKYPQYNCQNQTKVFADSIHKILNKNLESFNDKERNNIKSKILIDAINKEEFSVNAYDVFRECVILNNGENDYINSIEKWLNQNKGINVSSSELMGFLENVWKEPGNNVDDAINKAALSVGFENISYEEKVLAQDIEKQGTMETDEAVNNVQAIENKQKSAVIYFLRKIHKKLLSRLHNLFKYILKSITLNKKTVVLSISVLFICICAGIFGIRQLYNSSKTSAVEDYEVFAKGDMGIVDGLSGEFKYTDIDKKALKKWLNSKKSLLAEDKYLTPIIDASKEFNINPLLLIAITGQEQAFVPRNSKNAEKIANNPFNVFGSWQDYNTNIKDSSRLAAMTIKDSSNGRPVNADEIQWVNRKYAQDPNWWVGVTKIFYQMKNDIIK